MKGAQLHPRYPGFCPLDVRGSISHQSQTSSLTLALVHGQPAASIAHQAEQSSKHPKAETVSQGDPSRFVTHRVSGTAILTS